MIETLTPTDALEHAVTEAFQVTHATPVSDMKLRVDDKIRLVAREFNDGERRHVEAQLPTYLNVVFGEQNGTMKDPDYVQSDAVALLPQSFPELYHG